MSHTIPYHLGGTPLWEGGITPKWSNLKTHFPSQPPSPPLTPVYFPYPPSTPTPKNLSYGLSLPPYFQPNHHLVRCTLPPYFSRATSSPFLGDRPVLLERRPTHTFPHLSTNPSLLPSFDLSQILSIILYSPLSSWVYLNAYSCTSSYSIPQSPFPSSYLPLALKPFDPFPSPTPILTDLPPFYYSPSKLDPLNLPKSILPPPRRWLSPFHKHTCKSK